MTHAQFTKLMAYLSAGSGKEMSRVQVQVYFDLLSDLPPEALMLAVQRSLLENKFPTLPTIGALRELALEALEPNRLPGLEAWRMAVKYSGKLSCTLDYLGREPAKVVQDRILAAMPEAVRRAGSAIGWKTIAECEDPDITRAHFLKAYETMVGRSRREALMPPKVKELAALVGQEVEEHQPATLIEFKKKFGLTNKKETRNGKEEG